MKSKLKNYDKIAIFRIPYDKTSSFGKGADKGPEAILKCLIEQIEVYDHITKFSPANYLDFSKSYLIDVKNLAPEDMVKEVSSKIKKKIDEGSFIVSLGGEHSISIGIFDAISKTKLKDSLTIVQIDAHMDLRDDDSDYNANSSKFAHSCVMKRALDLGFKIVQVGIRAYAEFELKTAINNKVPVFEWPAVENDVLLKNIIKEIKTDNVYLTLDVDGLDPSNMPATGTPVQGGISWKFSIDFIKSLFNKKNIVGIDIVEVAPIPNSRLTEYGAAQLLYFMAALKFKDTV